MATPELPCRSAGRGSAQAAALIGLMPLLGAGMAAAQVPPGPQLDPPACPPLVRASPLAIEPLRIAPEQVPLKNRLSCLSPADAVYRPDGCPLRLCRYPDALDLPRQLPPP